MVKLILSNSGCIPSAKELREALVELGYPKILITTNPEKDILFRYGNSSYCNCNDLLNPPSFIKLLSNKKAFSNFCHDSEITAPVFTRIKDKMPENFPILVRSTLTGSKSEGIYPINSFEELAKMNINYWWVPYYNLTQEYRIHVVGGNIIKGFCKKFTGEVDKETGVIIRNNDNSQFSLIDIENTEKYNKLREIVRRVQDALYSIYENSILFYALDIGWGKNKKEYIIIEGNTAPGLNRNTALDYARILGPVLFGK